MNRKFNHIEVLKIAWNVFYACTGVAIAVFCASVIISEGILVY